MWLIFDCLIDGASALEFGDEPYYDVKNDTFEIIARDEWKPIVHFDMKPDNGKTLFSVNLFGSQY